MGGNVFAPPRVIPRHVIGSGIRPKLHLGAFAAGVAAGTATVAIIGDSVTVGPDTTMPMTVVSDPAALANPIARSELLSVYLKRKIRRDNPGKNITFKNFAVSGQGWANLASGTVTGNYPTWFNPTTNTWLSFVQAASPDLIIIALGANDGAGLDAAKVKTALSIIAGWSKIPSIVIVANWHAYLGGGVSAIDYAGQRANGTFLRTLCTSNGANTLFGLTGLPPIGFIDLARYQQLVEDGTDPAVQSLRQVLTNVSVPNGGNYTLPQTAGDFYLDVTWPGAAGASQFPGTLVDVGYRPGKSAWNIFNSGGTGVGLQLSFGGSATINTSTRSSGNVLGASGDIRLEISNRDDHWMALCNGKYFVDELAPRFIDTFAPTILPYSASTKPYVINSYCISDPVKVPTGLGHADSVGALNGTDGNGNNHPGSKALAYLHAAVFEAANFCAAEA